MAKKTKMQLWVLFSMGVIGLVPMILTGDASFPLAYLAVMGALVAGGLGTYTHRAEDGRPVERPGTLRAALLGDGTTPVPMGRWRTYQALRISGLALLVAGFVFAMRSSIVSWKQSTVTDVRIHRLQQTVDLLMHQKTVPLPVQQAYDESRRELR